MVRFWLKMFLLSAVVLISDRLMMPSPEMAAALAANPAPPVNYGWLALVLLGAAGWLVWAFASMAGLFDRPRGIERWLGELLWTPLARRETEAGDA